MVSTESIHDWSATLRRHLPLSRPQAKGLATWSMGVVASGSCGQTVVSHTLAQALDRIKIESARVWCEPFRLASRKKTRMQS